VKAGETVKILVHNQGALSHGLRIAGPDGEFDTADDFVAVPVGSDPKTVSGGDLIGPGIDGFTVVRFDVAAQIKFQDPTTTDPATGDSYVTGTIIVESEAPGSPTPPPEDQVDQSVDVEMQGAAFAPSELTLEAGKKFGINLTNTSTFVHNLRIDGADGEFETDDDILSPDIDPNGGAGKVIGTLGAGAYSFRDDFNPTQMIGTLVVE
jgi:plastocyanin